MKFVKRNISGFAIMVAFIIIFTILFILFSTDKPLTPYFPSEPTESSVVSTTDNYTEYRNTSPDFSVQIPTDWVKITQSGYPTWICREYTSSLQIQTFSSSPDLLNITRESVKIEVEQLRGELVDFYWMDEWDFTVCYRLYQKSGTTAHIEVTAFNTRDAVRFVFIITEIHYERISNIVAEILDSFSWDRFNVSKQSDGSTPES